MQVDADLQHIYLVTSRLSYEEIEGDKPLTHGFANASVVLGSRGVVVTPVAVDSSRDEGESLVRVVRDFGRSVVWLLSGRTGAGLNPDLD